MSIALRSTLLTLATTFALVSTSLQATLDSHTESSAAIPASLAESIEHSRHAFELIQSDYVHQPWLYAGTHYKSGITARFSERAARFAPRVGEWTWQLSLSGYGTGEQMRSITGALPQTNGNRLSYTRGLIEEWYVNDPAKGLEQGFTVSAPPTHHPDTNTIVLALQLGGDVTPARANDHRIDFVTDTGDLAFVYGGLVTLDANGQRLASFLQVDDNNMLTIHVDVNNASWPIVIDPVLSTDGSFLPALTALPANAEYGEAVAIHDDIAVAASPTTGEAWAYQRAGNSWVANRRAFCSGRGGFGESVDVAGHVMLIGAPLDDSITTDNGAVYEVKRCTTSDYQGASPVCTVPQQWVTSSVTAIVADTPILSEGLGHTVAIHGDRAAIGTRDTAAVYVFDREPSTGMWSQTQRLDYAAAGGAATSSAFEGAVALDGDMLVVGSHATNNAFIYEYNGSAWTLAQTVTNSDTVDGERFGVSVAIEGGTVVIGADIGDANPGVNDFTGAVYVFEQNSNGTWPATETKKIVASDAVPNDQYGWSIALAEGRLVVGAVGESGSQGKVYLYTKNTATGEWDEQLTPPYPNAASADHVAHALALAGDTLVVGASADDEYTSDGGSAAVIDLNEKIQAVDRDAEDWFGYSVSLSGDRALVGAYRDDGACLSGADCGAAHVFERDSSGSWVEQQKLQAIDRDQYDAFGWSVSLNGDRALVGSRVDSGDCISSGYYCGAAYVFERDENTGTWVEQQKLQAADRDGGDRFGYSVSLSGDRALVGADLDDGDCLIQCGAAYVFERDESTGQWIEHQKLQAADRDDDDYFGISVSLSGDLALVGAINASSGCVAGNFRCGAAYVFERNEAGTWIEQQQLHASDGNTGEQFGFQ